MTCFKGASAGRIVRKGLPKEETHGWNLKDTGEPTRPQPQVGHALPTEQQRRSSPQAGRTWGAWKQEEIQWTRTIVTEVYIFVEMDVRVCKSEMY